MSQPVQILMALYNSAAFLREQLDSISAQTHDNWRLTMRDDSSSDQTLAIAKEYVERDPDRFELVEDNDARLGARGNFARLLETADADYVMFADGDDMWLAEKIQITLDAMIRCESQANGAPVLVHTDLKVAAEDLSIQADSFWRYSHLDPIRGSAFNRLLIQNIVTGCTAMLNRPLVELSRPVPNDAIMHDWWIALVAASFGRIARVEQPTLLYRQHSSNDIGARQWNLTRIIRQTADALFSDDVRSRLRMTQVQAEQFLDRYRDRLSPEQACLVSDYANVRSRGFFARRRLILRHRLLKHGLARNLGLLWMI